MWSVFNNSTTKIRIAVSRDRGQTFSKAVTAPSQTGPSNTYVYPSVDSAGDLYIAFTAFPLNRNRTPTSVYVSRSSDDGQTFSRFVAATPPIGVVAGCCLPNTRNAGAGDAARAGSPVCPG